MAGKLKTTPLTPGFSEQLPEPFNIPFDKLPQPTDDYETLRRDLFRCGYCLIKDAVSKPHLAALQQRLQEQAQAEDETGWSTRDGGAATDILKGGWDEKAQQPNQKVYCLVNKGKCFRDLVTMPLTSKLVGELLNPKWILSSLWANIACPGGEPMAMHCDQGGITLRYHTREAAMKNADNLVGKTPKGYGGADSYASTLFKRWPKAPYGLKDLVKGFHKEPLPDILPPPLVCQVVYFLTDVTAENGGTCVVPGSHLSGILPPLDVEFTRVFPTANLSGPAGTACIFDGRLWHATGSFALSFGQCAT